MSKAYENVALESSGPGGVLTWKQDTGGHWRGTSPDDRTRYFDVIPMRGGGFHVWCIGLGRDGRTAQQAIDLGQHGTLGAAFGAARDYLDTGEKRAAEESAPASCLCPPGPCAHRHPPSVPPTACEGDPSAMPAAIPGELPMVKVVAENPAAFTAALAAAEALGPIDTPEKAYNLLANAMNQSDQEQLIVVALNLHGKVLGISEVNRGERESVNASMTQIMRVALNVHGCSAFFIAHNHPTGKARPSKADRDLTDSVMEACKPYRELAFVDHVVIGQKSYHSIVEKKKYSFRR